MKKIIFLLLLAAINQNIFAQKEKKSKTKDSTISFTVTEMGCKTDSKMVETSLYRLKGVKKVKINGEEVTVTFNPKKINSRAIIQAIENTGSCEKPEEKIHQVKIKT